MKKLSPILLTLFLLFCVILVSSCSNSSISNPFARKAAATDSTADTDGDGLSDEVELLSGTSPVLADTDGDGLPGAELMMRWLHTPAEAQPLAVSYLRIIFLGLPFLYLLTFISMALRGAGDARTPFVFLALNVGLDIALNPLFIFGLGPVPAMGIAGSATATLVAQVVTLAALIAWLYRTRHFLAIHGDELLIATGKGTGTGPNNIPKKVGEPGYRKGYTYIATLLKGSLARVNLKEVEPHLKQLTDVPGSGDAHSHFGGKGLGPVDLPRLRIQRIQRLRRPENELAFATGFNHHRR